METNIKKIAADLHQMATKNGHIVSNYRVSLCLDEDAFNSVVAVLKETYNMNHIPIDGNWDIFCLEQYDKSKLPMEKILAAIDILTDLGI